MLRFMLSAFLCFFFLLRVSIAATEAAFDHGRFCIGAQDVERRSNTAQGKWLDEYTRHDGMTVNCTERSVNLTLYVAVPFEQIEGNWQDRLNAAWSNDHCSDPAWAASIDNRWSIRLIVNSNTNETISLHADCH